MEKFKAVEKEMKTKAFSKDGLSAAAKLDPKVKEKMDCRAFLSEMVDELERQVETLEAEEESLQATVKKGKKDTSKAERLEEIRETTERHKWHLGKLELLLRALENRNIDVEQVNEAKDNIKFYVDENQSADFMEDDGIYDEFNLDQDEATWGISNEVDRVSSQDTQSVQDENADPSDGRSGSAPASKQKSSIAEPPSASARRPSNQLKSPLPALATLHTPLSNINSGAPTSQMKPAPIPTRAPGETLKYASAAAAAAANEKSSIAPLPPPPGQAASSLAPLPPPPSKASASTSPNVQPSVPASSQSAQSKAAAQPPPAPSVASTSHQPTQSPTVSHAASGSIPPTPALEKSETVQPARSKQVQQTLPVPQEVKEGSPEPDQPRTPHDQPGASNVGTTDAGPQIQGEEESIYHLPPGLQDLIQSFEITKSRTADPTSQPVQRLLAASHATCPTAFDAEKPRHYKPAHRYETPAHYPQEPFGLADDPSLYARIDTDTLFYIFYYRQGTYQQYLAAKSLKNQSWRFHKQYQTWFQRHEEPKHITEEYEQGTYRFFDYESTW